MPITTILVAVFIVAAAAAPVVGLIAGIAGFSPERARAVLVAESLPAFAPEQIQQLRIRHPDIIRVDRLDRHDSYIWLLIGLWCYGWWAGFLSPVPQSNLSTQSIATQQVLAMSLIVGTTLALIGVVLGLRIGRWHIARFVSSNPLAGLLGADIRMPYALAWFGLLSAGVSMGVYAWTTWTAAPARLLGTLGGWLSMATCLMCLTLGARLLVRLRRYTVERDQLIAEVVALRDGDT